MSRILVGHDSPLTSGIVAGQYDVHCVKRTLYRRASGHVVGKPRLRFDGELNPGRNASAGGSDATVYSA